MRSFTAYPQMSLSYFQQRNGQLLASDLCWPRVTTLNQELAKTELSLVILMRNLVLLDHCSWATSCQQFLRKLFNHPQLQRNRWRTGKKKYSEVYALVKSKFKDTKAKDDINTKNTFFFPPEKFTCRDFCFPIPLHWELHQSSACCSPQQRDLFDFSEPFNRDSLF